MSGRLAAAGWARRGHAALRLEVSVGERLQAGGRGCRGAARGGCALALCVRTPFCAQPARLAETASPAEADWVLR